MKAKKRSWQSLLFMVVTILALLMPQTVFATGGTDGTELQVAEPASLEIQLGADWAGVEFELKTDAGMYPGDVVVGDDGVLRLEIGGSKSYSFDCHAHYLFVDAVCFSLWVCSFGFNGADTGAR